MAKVTHLGQCSYCRRMSETLRLVQLREYVGAKWQRPCKALCLNCRRYLTGVHFRYYKEADHARKN
jgi:hypothetical protein